MIEQPRQPKKSETIEFRLSFEEKTAFLTQAAKAGQSASDVLRQFVSGYGAAETTVVIPAKNKKITKNRYAISAILAAIGLVGVPVLANQTLFAAYDVDGNGRVTAGEISAEGDAGIIAALDTDKNGWVSLLELKPEGRGEIFHEIADDFYDGVPKRWLEFSFVTFELKPDRSVVQDIKTGRAAVPMDATDAQVLAIQSRIRAHMTKS